jgi:hypothetical protein
VIGRGIFAAAATLTALLSAAPVQAATDRVNYRADAGSPPKVFYKTPSAFELEGECTAAGRLKVTVIGLDDHAIVHAASDLNGADYLGDDDLTEGEELSLGPLGLDKRAGTLAGVAISGEVQTVTWLAEDTRGADPYGGRRDCAFVGTTDGAPEYFGGTAGVTSEQYDFNAASPPADGSFVCNGGGGGDISAGVRTHSLDPPDLIRATAVRSNGSGNSQNQDFDFNDGFFSISGAQDSSIGWGVLTESNDVSTLTSYTAMGEDNTGANDPFAGASADDDCVMGITSIDADAGQQAQVALDGGASFLKTNYQRAGLKLHSTCDESPVSDIGIEATTTKSNANLHVGLGLSPMDISDFDPGESVDVLPGADRGVLGQLSYSTPSGTHLTIVFVSDEDGLTTSGAENHPCSFVGTSTVSAP